MRVLLVGQDDPGSLVSSIRPALSKLHEVVTTNLAHRGGDDGVSIVSRIRRRVDQNRLDVRLEEAAAQHEPDVVLMVKGRGVTPLAVRRIRRRGARVVVYYPDNPLWRFSDGAGALPRLAAADCVILWSSRLGSALRGALSRIEVLPFGYDGRWFRPGRSPDERRGIVFLGTWSPRRERYLSALSGLPMTVAGSSWPRRGLVAAGPPIVEEGAGALLGSALIGVNLLHPANAGAHNMRTREIAACGALELTDPGTDGTPLRNGESCVWFHDPGELRIRATEMLASPERAMDLAAEGRSLIIGDTYDARAATMAQLLSDIVS